MGTKSKTNVLKSQQEKLKEWSKLLFSVVVMSAIILAGCATEPAFQEPTYQATVLSQSDGAIVRVSEEIKMGLFHSMFMRIDKVDERSVSSEFWYGPILLDPGMRVLSISGYYNRSILQDIGRVELNATFNAGHTYLIKAERNETLMTFWVEDEKTHDEVSKRQTTNVTTILIL
jgi:hypothetical protein